MIQRALQHRSGRVISSSRLALASVFLLAIWLDPSQPSRHAEEAYLILASYVAVAAVYAVLTWDDWWLEHRLAAWAHGFDIALFGVMVFLTEGYTSPFFTFFVFIVLSATIKWSWRETAITSALIILLFFVAGWAALNWAAGDFEMRRFIIRGTYLIVLSLVLIWFGINQHAMHLRQLGAFQPAPGDASAVLPIRRALDYTAARTGAARVAFAWCDREEPWIDLALLESGRFSHERHGPETFGSFVDPQLSGCTFLFRHERRQVIMRCDGRNERSASIDRPLDPALAARIGGSGGLGIPIECEHYSGIILAIDIAGLSTDDLATGEHIADEVSAALHRASTIGLSEEAAETRTRLSLTRDIHDSIIQLLAGTSFRLEGIRKSAEAGRDINPDVKALQQELSTEQRQLRTFIGDLRSRDDSKPVSILCDGMRALLERMERQWNVACELTRCPEDLKIPSRLDHEVHQIVREAIANAVRHGKADHVSISLDAGQTGLSLIVADNGAGFPVEKGDGGNEEGTGPWSLNERVHELGGTLVLYSTARGSRITISIPFGAMT